MNTVGDKCVEGSATGSKYPSWDNCTYYKHDKCVDDPEPIAQTTTALFFTKPVNNIESASDEIVGVTVEDDASADSTASATKTTVAEKRKTIKLVHRAANEHVTELAQINEVQPEELTAGMFEKPGAEPTPKRKSNPSIVSLISIPSVPTPAEGAGALMADGELPEESNLDH